MLNKLFLSVLEMDRSAVVICDLNHVIVYMNPAAKVRYQKWGGDLVGQNLKDCHSEKATEIIAQVVAWFKADKKNNMIFTSRNDKENKDVYMVALRDEAGELIGYYEKHEYRNAENSKLYDFSKSLV